MRHSIQYLYQAMVFILMVNTIEIIVKCCDCNLINSVVEENEILLFSLSVCKTPILFITLKISVNAISLWLL